MALETSLKSARTITAAHPTRTALVLCFILIGIGTVVWVLATAPTLTGRALLPPDILIVRNAPASGAAADDERITYDDARAMFRLPGVAGGARVYSGTAEGEYQGKSAPVSVRGVDMIDAGRGGLRLSHGRWFAESRADEAVLVEASGPNPFASAPDLLGKTVKVDGVNFLIVGIAPADNGVHSASLSLVITVEGAMNLLGADSLSEVRLQAAEPVQLGALKNNVAALLGERHHVHDGSTTRFLMEGASDFTAADGQPAALVLPGVVLLSLLIAVVAGVPLLIDGVGARFRGPFIAALCLTGGTYAVSLALVVVPPLSLAVLGRSAWAWWVVGVVVVGGAVAATTCTLLLLHRWWSSLPDGERRASPGRAVGFCLVPLFNLYWMFVAFPGLASDLNAALSARGRAPRAAIGLAVALCVASLVLTPLRWVPWLSAPWLTVSAGLVWTVLFFCVSTNLTRAAESMLNSTPVLGSG